jgi:hypothetical protein
METIRRPQGSRARASAFRRAVLLQVYLPLVLGAVLVLGTIVLSLVAGGPGGATPRGMADVALIALLIPVMIFGLIALVAASLLALGVAWLIGWLPRWAHKAQRLVEKVAHQSDRIAGRVAQSVVAPKSVWSAMSAAWARLIGKR